MSARDPDRRVHADMMRYKQDRNQAQAQVRALHRQVVALATEHLVARPEYVFELIEWHTVIREDGTVDVDRLLLKVDDLLVRRPELAATYRRVS